MGWGIKQRAVRLSVSSKTVRFRAMVTIEH